MGPYTDVSIDLETIGTRPGSVITQIGLCAFRAAEPENGALQATLIHVKAQSMMDHGFLVEWDTLSWWLKQDEKARIALCEGQVSAHHIEHALQRTAAWFDDNMTEDAQVWGYGATFDVTQLEIAFRRMAQDVPWQFRQVRDIRTLVALRPSFALDRPVPKVAHNAMDDAVAQAKWVKQMLRDLTVGYQPEPALQP